MADDLPGSGDAGENFSNIAMLECWLAEHHSTATELWVRVFKKKSGVVSVTWDDCVVAALIWGWIDGQKRSLDDVSYLQRLTPRRPRSNWSTRNTALAEQLIAERRVTPAGLAQVQAAKDNGLWDNAYAGLADMEIPADFLAALEAHPVAKERYNKLPRSKLFEIYISLKSARHLDTRSRRMASIIKT